MIDTKIFAHCSYIGNTGYNQHSRDFFRELSNYYSLKVRNFTIGSSWNGFNETPHDGEPYLNDTDRKLLFSQILWNNDGSRSDYPIYPNETKNFFHNLNIVLCETDHHIFYDRYIGPKIAYNVWESTLQPQHFFDKLKEFDQLWVPSEWQRQCSINQGYDPDKVKVVPEGIDPLVFFPEIVNYPLTQDGRFKFFLAGRWDYRKFTKEIIETFLTTFSENDKVDLIVSIDNPFSNDGMSTTEERLEHFGINDDRIKILHFPSREDYIKILKSCDVFLSCARSEGWNLPLIEAMACGIPSIYSECSGQMEFASGKGIPVKILGESPVSANTYNHFNSSVGNYYEPDKSDLSLKMLYAYINWEYYKNKALQESEIIRNEFSWSNVSRKAKNIIDEFMKDFKQNPIKNDILVTYLDGPRVEIVGQSPEEYFVEFIDLKTNEIKYSTTISNGMWCACSIKYYVEWGIRVNGEIVDRFDPVGKTILISLESSSLGDTIGWAPYAVEFQKKNNCKVLLSTFQNFLFEGLNYYNDIQFVKPGESHNCYAVYRIGWFKKNGLWNDTDRNPNQVNLIPLQQTATDILGLDFFELNYGLNIKNYEKYHKKRYVVFGPQATAGCKEWSFENWCELAKMVKSKGYDIFVVSQKEYKIPETFNFNNKSLQEVMTLLLHADKFIGLGSGLSWINWALGKHTYMINGFARPGHEFTSNTTRIYNDNTCVFCWNDEVFTFDPSDWDWCPVYKGTKKQHVCQRSISTKKVFDVLNLQ
jgi:autotransporter strand-loop-strand O-heptosyltransferase